MVSPDDIGNVHYGYTGTALGMPLDLLKAGSFGANIKDNIIPEAKMGAFRKIFKSLVGEYDGEKMISWGAALFHKYGALDDNVHFVA